VSRPTVVKLIDDGVLPSRKVGSHRRVTPAELLAYRDDIVGRRRGVLDQMSRDAEELGRYG
jgi:excisionase family DNA binding protein